MVALDWRKINEADVEFIANDEDAAENYFELLTTGDINEEEASNTKQVVKLFQVSKAVLRVKGLQYETALDEMEKITQETSAEREKELIEENERLLREIGLLKKESGSGDNYYRNEVLKLEERNKLLQTEMDELDRRLLKEQNSFDRVNGDLQSLESRYQSTKHELDRALSDLQEYQRQFQAQRENLLATRTNDDDVRGEMSKKNRELSEYLDEIKQLQDANDQLQSEVTRVQKEMEQATLDMNSMADDYTKLKTVLEDTDTVVEDMRKERDLLRAQIQDMQTQLQKRTDGDDEIMIALNKKVAEWKDIMISKDQEISEKDRQLFDLEKQLQASKLDSDRSSMIQLMDANAKKDVQIKELKDKVEMATQDYDDVTSQIKTLKTKSSDGGASILQQRRIQALSKTILDEKSSTMKEQQRVMEVEQDVISKDQQISELLNKIIQYEQGQYGLSEAVQEIKDCRSQIRARDKTIEDVTKQINEVHIEMNDLNLENEEMRERLGINSREELDTDGIRKKRAIKEEQALALNRVLQKEVEKLEEERVKLKQALRKAAEQRGERAVNLGLTSIDLEPVESEIVIKPVKTVQLENTIGGEQKITTKKNNVVIKSEETEDHSNEVRLLADENKNLKAEVHQLEIGLREIHGAVKQSNGQSSILQLPALDKLIAIIEERHATGQYDTTVQLKAQLSHIYGRNEELRSELRNSQEEISKYISELDKRSQKITIQENEIDSLRELSAGVIKLNPLPLPEGIAPTSKDIIACLNEYLIQILQELANKEDICSQMEEALEKSRRDFSIALHQQSVLYEEYLQMKDESDNMKMKFKEEKQQLYLTKDGDVVKLQEFDKLLDNLKTDPSDYKKLLAELSRKITVLRVNEKSLARRYTILQEVEKGLRNENGKLKGDILELEASVTKKIGDLQRHKDLSVYKLTSLQKSLEDTVPSSEVDLSNRQFNELTAKYRELLQQQNNYMAHSVAIDSLQVELKAWQHSENTIKEKLLLEKERSYVLEQTLNDLVLKLGEHANGVEYKTEEISALARKLATLEMKELNERERADHANMKYDQLRKLVTELENRNSDLEQKFAEISKINIESQRIERELREELSNCVPADVNRTDKSSIKKLEDKQGLLLYEHHRLKEIADIAQHQVGSITVRQKCQEKELTSLRKQLHDLQMETDEKTVIAKLHQQLVALQVSESMAVRKLEVSNHKVSKLETFNLRLQGLLDEKNEALFHLRYEGRSKSKYLKKTIQDLRRQFSGALTLGRQEKFSNTLKMYQDKKLELERELKEAQMKRLSSEDESLEYQVKLNGLQELIATLKDGQGAKKVAEWHNVMSQIKLEDMKLKRSIAKNKDQINYLEKINMRHEETISILEEENIKQAKEYEDRQLLWEQHEVELERSIAKLEKQQRDVMETARRFEEATGSIPDESLPIANQLELAIGKIKEHIKTIIIARQETNNAKEDMDSSRKKLRASETALMHKDKIINELRLRLPISERNIILTEPTSSQVTEVHRDVKQALHIAHTTVDSLKLMLEKKDDTLAKYQNMLNKSRQELQSQADSHRQEMKLLQDRLQLEIEEHIKKIKKIHQEYINAPQAKLPTNQQLHRLSELEDMLSEQDNALGTASEKYRQGKQEIKVLRDEAEDNIKRLKQHLKDEEQKHAMEIKKLQQVIESEKNTLREKDLEIEVLTQEIDSLKEASEKTPSKTMKSLVERLRNQLAKKDKEQKALSQALMQIRSDMVVNAEENVQAYSKKIEEEVNVQKIVERETEGMKGRIEELQERMNKLKKDLKKKKENELQLNDENESLKKDIQRKDGALRDMAFELKEREEINEKYDALKTDFRKLEKTSKQPKEKVDEGLVELTQEKVNESSQPFDMNDLDERPVKEIKSKEEVIRWEESKKWKKKLETMKSRLKEKNDECSHHEKTSSMLREAVARQEKDKLMLNNRLKSMSKSSGSNGGVSSFHHEDTMANLKKRIFQLEDENNELLRKENFDRQKEIQELRIDNSQLRETLRALETELSRQQGELDPDGYNWSLHREQSLQKEMLEIRKENMELQFENEQANKDNPRLKSRVSDLTEYVEVLKNELELSRKKDKQKKSALGTGQGGQSIEDMERVIAAMRRVVERLQTENEALKKQNSKSKPHNDLVKENRNLKQEMQKLKQAQTVDSKKLPKMTAAPYTVKLTQENEKLRKDLKKEKEISEELRLTNESLKTVNEKLRLDVEEKNQDLSDVNKRADTMTTNTDGRLNKSLVVSKLYEDKMKSLENEVHKKNNILKEIKTHLRGSAEREAELLRKVDELEDRVNFLQNFPCDIVSEDDAIKHYQQSRLQVRRLEAEKEELTFELERLRKLSNNGEKQVDVTQDEILDKLRKYDRMLAVEVDLRTRIKGMEIEREKLHSENKKLKKELSAFDPSFFEELEDLKYNYKKSVERNIIYEKQLEKLSKQFGVSVNIS